MYQMKAIASLHNKTVHISIHQTTAAELSSFLITDFSFWHMFYVTTA